MHGISHWLNQPVTYIGVLAMFVTWQVCDLLSAAWQRRRKQRKSGIKI